MIRAGKYMKHSKSDKIPGFKIGVFLALCLPWALYGQSLNFRSAPWEGEIPLERYAYDPLLGTQEGQEYRQVYEFFPTNSGSSGERYISYQRFQVGSQAAVQKRQAWSIDLPLCTSVEALDYRIWEEGRIVYEAKQQRLEQDVRVQRNPATGRVERLQLRLRELAPRRTVELFYALEGVPLPRTATLQGAVPYRKSHLRIDVLSAYPLRFDTSGIIEFEKKEVFDYYSYRFTAENLSAAPHWEGPRPWLDHSAVVRLDWQELLRRDEEKLADWAAFLPYLFYQGHLRDYPVFVNSEINHLSEQVNAAGLRWPPRYFHERKDQLRKNYYQRWAHYNLADRYDALLVDLEERLEKLEAQIKFQDPLQRLSLIHARVDSMHRALKALRKTAGQPPGDYGLWSKFYYDGFGSADSLLKPVLFQHRHDQATEDFLSVRPYQAMGLALKDGDRWHLLLLGPYLGRLYPLDQLPTDLLGGRALVFNDGEEAPLNLPLDSSRIMGSAFVRKVKLWPVPGENAFWREDELRLQGNFQDILYYGHLTGDTIPHFGFISPFLAQRHGFFNMGAQQFAPRKWLVDSVSRLPLKLAGDQLWSPNWSGPFCLPINYRAIYQFVIPPSEDLVLELELDSAFAIPQDGAVDWRWEQGLGKKGESLWTLSLLVTDHCFENREQFMAWHRWLEKGLYLRIQDE